MECAAGYCWQGETGLSKICIENVCLYIVFSETNKKNTCVFYVLFLVFPGKK